MVAKITHLGTHEIGVDENGQPMYGDFKKTITLDESKPISEIKNWVFKEVNSPYRGGRVFIEFYNS